MLSKRVHRSFWVTRSFEKLDIFFIVFCWVTFYQVDAIHVAEGFRTVGGCSQPEVVVNGSRMLNRGGIDFDNIQEVQFFGIIGPFGYKRVCKIRCIDGAWTGPLCAVDEDNKLFQPLLRQCVLRPTDAELVVSHEGKVLTLDQKIRLPHGIKLSMRCSDVGMYKFIGNKTVECKNGEWSSPFPHCFPTTIQTNFSDKVPPTITYNVADGDLGVTMDGHIVILPNSTVHFDCLFKRERGNPEWTWTTKNRHYPSGWAISKDERSWKYRLSIYFASAMDTGTLTCKTPRGHSNYIEIIVKDVSCPPISSIDHKRVMAIEGTRLQSKARFACVEGYVLRGEEEITCTAVGRWSHAVPICEVIQCSVIVTESPHLIMSTRNHSYGTNVNFSCPTGYRLVGPSTVTCLRNETWSESPPVCELIKCKPPVLPKNGRILDEGRYLQGSIVTYTCHIGFILIGSSFTVCNNDGQWSHPPPLCRPACEFPGQPSNGRVVPTKFQYDVDEFVVVRCSKGFRRLGPRKLQCTSLGHWSSSLPHCRPYRDKLLKSLY
ncbi:locomotion-related protein Hikaru genki-like isoform X1 [Tachypleus tridentatus]|uniref:locomotion-related protein Hikaru genki-like isoform X1 n=2 Tax=Tachypleus tridentatus TaxID=6853 RepID=UPI003FD4A46A